MKVWALFETVEYEGDTLLSLHASRLLAVSAVHKIMKDHPRLLFEFREDEDCRWDSYILWEVGMLSLNNNLPGDKIYSDITLSIQEYEVKEHE